MSRTRAIALLMGTCALLTAIAVSRWPDDRAALACPAEEVHLDQAGVAQCGPGRELPVGQAITVGQRVDLHRVSAEDLALVPGLSLELARRIVAERERRGGFHDWDEVDQVDGVGEARLARLQEYCRLGSTDGGV